MADRWHLMENASRAFLDAVLKSMRQIRTAIGAATINPSLLTAAARIQYEGYQRREEENATILGLVKDGSTCGCRSETPQNRRLKIPQLIGVRRA